MVSRVSVTLAIALTTTTGCWDWRPWTMEATRSMALASSTEVPPNFMTIIGGAPSTQGSGCRARDPHSTRSLRSLAQGRLRLRLKTGSAQDDARIPHGVWLEVPSSQISLGLEQLCVQDGGSGSSANGVVREHGEFPVE